ncbi:Murein DD-endopeptidase MepM and murein hydrolase activator NlpD, contain LysM domain [Lentzea albidocapillata subsp. violacea]|uniref:Murein DD-endopeptidase MepM and murein hydrolase activator NlpD, contain LysM domain n=1 Tax=Lentzea albidocapillata subsp. violacea TaxID=128104 RepID=A0A1G9YXM0_9PSEU|nr:peptidoglycan DD-metalloendopeptidase family protein [Lentzea albidocapillata]SDN13868.1 Murein DD-endopeptidase MepM and murein hydrolase activator NlpD, contain LysM domain [Lentzea albidocapillata subsp. violacea]
MTKSSTMAVGGGVLGFLGLMLSLVMCGASVQISDISKLAGTVPVGGELKSGAVPEKYRALIIASTKMCPEITAPLLGGLLRHESAGWNENAVSPVGAQGLAQFMPSTWAAVGKDYNGNGVNSPFDWGDSIPAAGKYLCDSVGQIRRAGLKGDVIDLALASYNAGFGAVLRYGGIPPYQETQKYVKIIRGYAAEFTAPDGGLSSGGGAWVYPLIGTKADCSSGFGARWGEFHYGLDLAAPIGVKIGAAAAGTVIAAGPASGYGQWVKIQHAGGVVTIYGHVETYVVAVGQQVQAGTLIATVGNRGQSTGPHLHFQIDVAGKPVDPEAYYKSVGGPPLCR